MLKNHFGFAHPTPSDRFTPWIRVLSLFLAVSSVPAAELKRELPTADRLQQFGEEMRTLKDTLRLPGLSIAIVRDGTVVYRQMEGFANLEKKIPISTDNLFQIASITKTFTANLLMQYEEQQRASTDDYALNYRFIDTYFGWPYNIDPNTRIRHFLSHTSEDGPGRSFVYNGQRFNFIYGVFEAAGGYAPFTEGYSEELKKRIFKPLGLNHSLTGFPKKRDDPTFAQIAVPYVYDREKSAFVEDTVNYQWTQAFPATGILSTIDDLARYTTSYDQNELITASSYAKVTTPQVLLDGSVSPYGLGWFTETFAGRKLHWHYGHADSYAALLLRVPETGYTFLMLSNSNAPSDALRLGSGHVWQSPFASAFLQYFVLPTNQPNSDDDLHSLEIEHDIGVALFSHHAAKLYRSEDAAPQIVERVFAEHPERFDQYDAALISLLTDLSRPEFRPALDRLITSYERHGHLQPYVMADIAGFFERIGEEENAYEWSKRLADSEGFETWSQVTDAAKTCGRYLIDRGDIAQGRSYYWRAVNTMKMAGADDNAIKAVIAAMNRATSAPKKEQ